MHSSELDSITWKLMTPTRALESVFKAWAQGDASETEVSDQYVRLGNEFIAARSRLAHGGVPTEDLIDVPQQLRGILEEALALNCSPDVAERFDPQIRAIMTQLFHQLKEKQLQLTSSPYTGSPSAQQQQQPQRQPQQHHRDLSNEHHTGQTAAPAPQARRPPHSNNSRAPVTQAQPPSHHSQMSMQYPRSRAMSSHSLTESHSKPSTHSSSHSHSNISSSAHPRTAQNPNARFRAPSGHASAQSDSSLSSTPFPPHIHAPKPPVARDSDITEEDALSQLQRHGALERQASKRYSTRQISRMINGTTAEQISLPTTGVHKTFNTPEFKDSNVLKESGVRPDLKLSVESSPPETPEQSVHRKASMSLSRASRKGSMIKRPDSNQSSSPTDRSPVHAKDSGMHLQPPSPSLRARRSISANSASSLMPPSPGKLLSDDEFPVFLRVGNSIRKAMLTKPPSIAAIRLKFVEVCAYIHSGDETFPEITLQDPQSGVNYEVTEATVSDVNEGSLLTLRVKTSEELSMEAELKEIKNSIKELGSKMSHANVPSAAGSRGSIVKQTSFGSKSPYLGGNASKFPSPVLTGEGRFKLEKPPPPPREVPIDKVEIVNREIAIIRQLSNKTIAGLRNEVQKLKTEVKELTTASASSSIADRRSMNIIKQKMEASSQELLSQMENLSDIIDAQRVGIGSHGVRYPQNELEKVRRQLTAWSAEFEKSEEFIQSEKPVWKKTWQAELNNVIEDQEWLKSLDLLYSDLRSDLDQSLKTFELVCEANSLPQKTGLRQGLPIAPPIKPGEEQAVADAVFHEITALNLNHEQRAEAVQRAERLHRARLALRSEEFEDELNTFVADARLKPNGGFEEVERRIREREDSARKLGEQSEAEARKGKEALRQERKAKRQAANNSETWHDTPSELNASASSQNQERNKDGAEAQDKKFEQTSKSGIDTNEGNPEDTDKTS